MTQIAPVAQWIEHRSSEPRVTGSSPVGRVPIDGKLLRAAITLTFETSDNGYQMDVARIVLDVPAGEVGR